MNQRYIADAALRAQSVKQEHCLFGGRKSWKKLLSGLITKDRWHEIRDSELYSRGDRTKKGNPNIRVLRTPDGYRLRVVEVDAQGNMIRHQYLGSQRILFARHDKRRHDIEALAKKPFWFPDEPFYTRHEYLFDLIGWQVYLGYHLDSFFNSLPK